MDIDNVIYADVTYSDTSKGYKFRISAYSRRLLMTITLFEAFIFGLDIRYYFSILQSNQSDICNPLNRIFHTHNVTFIVATLAVGLIFYDA